MPEPVLKPEFEYYLAHQPDLIAKYRGQFVVIKGGAVLGAYPTELGAIRETSKTHQLGTFLVQKCEPGEENYTRSFHSRVAFV
jgi:hypothetical protein